MSKNKAQVNEGVLDDMDEDGWMAKSQLYQTAKMAIELHKMIQEEILTRMIGRTMEPQGQIEERVW